MVIFHSLRCDVLGDRVFLDIAAVIFWLSQISGK